MASIWDRVNQLFVWLVPDIANNIARSCSNSQRITTLEKASVAHKVALWRSDETLRQTVKAFEAKNGPGLPGRDLSKAWAVSLSPEQEAWQAARELLVGINKAMDELGGDA
jgi:hypothetical protein